MSIVEFCDWIKMDSGLAVPTSQLPSARKNVCEKQIEKRKWPFEWSFTVNMQAYEEQ